jgi:hypothetical protein
MALAKLKPVKIGKPRVWAQALDNKSEDIHRIGMKSLHGKDQVPNVDMISKITDKGKQIYVGRTPLGRERVFRHGDDMVLEIPAKEVDEAGRVSGATVLIPGGGKLNKIKALDFAKRYATKATDRTFTRMEKKAELPEPPGESEPNQGEGEIKHPKLHAAGAVAGPAAMLGAGTLAGYGGSSLIGQLLESKGIKPPVRALSYALPVIGGLGTMAYGIHQQQQIAELKRALESKRNKSARRVPAA